MSTHKETPINVTAIYRGYYAEQMREPGAEFEIQKLEHFSFFWMKSDDPRIASLDAPLARRERA